MYTVFVLMFYFSNFQPDLLSIMHLVAYSYSFYKSANVFYVLFGSGYYHISFIGFRFTNVCVTSQLSFYDYLFSFRVRVHSGKKVIVIDWLTVTVYTFVWWYSFALVRLRHILHLRKVSTCFRVLISTCFTSLSLITKKVTC